MHLAIVRQTIFLCVAIVAISSSEIFSQSSPPNSADSPVELQKEPHHHLRFENSFVRAWDTLIPGHSTTLWHVHRHDNIVLTLNDADVRVETAGAAPSETHPKLGDVGFRKAPYVHRTMSISVTPFHNMAIEILSSPLLQQSQVVRKPEERYLPVLENERARIYRISLAPGESTGMQRDLLPGLEVSMTPSMIELALPGEPKPQSMKVSAGDVRWRPGTASRAIKNVGNTRYEAVDIELK